MKTSLGSLAVVMLLEMSLLMHCRKVVCQPLKEVLLHSLLEAHVNFLTMELTPVVMLLLLGVQPTV